ncbi:Glutathione-disulfide reductase, partial [Globisporangium polare]
MAWADEQHAEWDLELQRMRYGFPPVDAASSHNNINDNARPPQHNGGHAMDANVDMERANEFNVANAGGGLAHAQQSATMTYSASCPSFTALYELSSDDDLIRDIQAGGNQQQRASGFMTGSMTTQQAPHHNQQLQPHLHEHELTTALNSGPMAPHFDANDKSYDFLLQMQQEHLDASMRQYPHQQTHFQGVASANAAGVDHFALFNQPRRPLHASASFTSLSSMETEYRRQSASKRKKGGERWYKMQRHKSFDSTTTSPATSMEFSAYSGTSSQFESTPEHNFLEEVPDADMIGFSIDDFPSTFTSDASWPMPLTLGGGIPFEAYTTSNDGGSALAAANVGTDDLLEPAPLDLPPHRQDQQQPVAQASEVDAEGKTNAVDNQSTADIDLLLSDQERANMSSLFDAIRDFESPPAAAAATVAPPATVTTASTTTTAKGKTGKPTKLPGKEKRGSGTKKKTHSPPLHPSRPRASSIENRAREKSFSLLSSSAPASSSFMNALQRSSKSAEPAAVATPDQPQQQQGSSTPLSVRERLQCLLTKPTSSNANERTQLTEAERTYIESSPLFSPHKASETAGSLWLILHAARCEFGCEIAGCGVMRRVVKHCLNCDVVVGKCRDPCNEAKTMMLHFGSCSGADCSVCHKLKEIDQAHNAIKNSPRMPQQSSPSTPPFLSIPMTPQQQQAMAAAAMGRVPIAPHPKFGSSPNLRSLAPSGGASKHVPIQPNPLPTSSNPMGLMGSFPHFGYSLSLYLEQTSAPFRAEVKARVEKRVTSAAGQDLIQHMQKKTRLRSLDDLRSDARTLVLGELERELHFHMQALSWATANKNNKSGASPTSSPQLGGPECPLPPYLLSAAASGFASFYSQQASFHAAMTGMAAAGGSAGAPFSSTPPTSATSPASRRKVSFGMSLSPASTPPSASTGTPTSALKSTVTPASE